MPGLRVVQGLLLPRPALRPEDDGHGAAEGGLEGRPPAPSSAGSARPTSSPRTCTSRSARPAAGRRRSTRSRSSTAGSCSRRPRSTAPPARTRSTARRLRQPGAADVEAAADPAHALRPEPRDLRLRPQRHPHRPDRPPRPGDARVPHRPRLPAHDHLAQVRPLDPHHLRQRQRALDRQRGRHRADQRPAGARQPGPGHARRGAGQGPAARSRGRWSRTRSSR